MRIGVCSTVFQSFGVNGASDGSPQRRCNRAVVSAACTASLTWVGGSPRAATAQNLQIGPEKSPLRMSRQSIEPQSVSGRRWLAPNACRPVSPSNLPQKRAHLLRFDASFETAKSGAGFRHGSTPTRRLRHHAPCGALSGQIRALSKTISGQSFCGQVSTSRIRTCRSRTTWRYVVTGTSTRRPWSKLWRLCGLFSGLRRNEIARLHVGCIRWQDGELQPDSQPVCFLHVPVNKTGTAFSKPVDGVVGRAVELWEQMRPPQPASLDLKTGEQVRRASRCIGSSRIVDGDYRPSRSTTSSSPYSAGKQRYPLKMLEVASPATELGPPSPRSSITQRSR